MERLKPALIYIAARMKEPSTYAGLSTALTGIGVAIAPEQWQEIMTVCMGLGGLMAVVLADKPKE